MQKITTLYKSSPFLRHNLVFFFGSLAVGALNYLYYPVIGHFMNAEDFGEVQTLVSLFLQFAILMTALSLITVNVVANQHGQEAKTLTPSPHPAKKPGPGFFTPFSTKTVPLMYAFRRKTAKNSLSADFLPVNGGVGSGSETHVIYELEKLALLIVSGLTFLLIATSIMLKNFLQFQSAWPFIALAFCFLVTVPFTFRAAYLRGKHDFAGSSIGDALGSLVKIIFSVLLVYAGLRTFGAIAGIALSQVVAFLFVVFRARRLGFVMNHGKQWFTRPNVRILVPELKYGVFVFVISLIIITQLSIDIVVIKHYFSPTDAGQYAGIAAMARIIYFVTASIISVLFTSVRLINPRPKNRRLLLSSMGLLLLIGGGTLLIFTIFPKLILGILFPKYLDFASLLPRLSLSIFVISIANMLFVYYMALRRYWILLAAALGALITYILLLTHHGTMSEVVNNILYGNLSMIGLLAIGTVGYKVLGRKTT